MPSCVFPLYNGRISRKISN
jgi:hypothetical protein